MFRLVQTCGACPEQYDVYLQGSDEVIGYMRLRHGFFYAQYLGQTVYEANTHGDGIFDGDERSYHLNLACQAIKRAMEQEDEEMEDMFIIEGIESGEWYGFGE